MASFFRLEGVLIRALAVIVLAATGRLIYYKIRFLFGLASIENLLYPYLPTRARHGGAPPMVLSPPPELAEEVSSVPLLRSAHARVGGAP